MKRCVSFAGGMALLLSACATPPAKTSQPTPPPAPPVTAQPAQTAAPVTVIDPEVMYEVLVGELAGQRGVLGVSVDNYLRAAHASKDPRVAERATRIAIYARDDRKALAAAKLWVTLEPENREARQIVATLYVRNGQPDNAVSHLEWILMTEEGSTAQKFMLISSILGREKDKRAAMRVMAKLVENRQSDPDAMFAYAHLTMRAGDYAATHQVLDKVDTLRPNWADALVLRANLYRTEGDTEQALSTYQKAVTLEANNVNLRLGYARLLVDERRFTEARREFKKLAKLSPDDGDVLFALGLLALQAEQPGEAREYFQRLIKLELRMDEASYFLGQIAEADEDFNEAIRWYRRVEGGDNHFEAQLRVALLLARQEKLDAARQQLETLAEAYPDEAVRVYLTEGEMLRTANRNQDAYEVYTAALLSFPDSAELLYARAMVAEQLDRLDILEQDLLSIVEQDPDNAQALNALGYTLADRTTRYDEAHEYISRALALSPDDAAILDSMGWVLYRQGRYPESIQYLRRALELSGNAEIAAHLGEVLWVSGKQDEARQVWDEALQHSPEDKVLQRTMKQYLP